MMMANLMEVFIAPGCDILDVKNIAAVTILHIHINLL